VEVGELIRFHKVLGAFVRETFGIEAPVEAVVRSICYPRSCPGTASGNH